VSLALGRGVQLEIGPFLVRVQSEHRSVLEHLQRFYAGFPMRDSTDAHFDVAVLQGNGLHRWFHRQAIVSVNGSRPFYPLPATLAGPLVEWGLNWTIGRHVHQFVVVHASVVERNGRAIIFPATSGAGKSTLAAGLAYSGWRLLSDEFAIINPVTGQLHPFPRPISLKEASIELIRGRHPDVIAGPEGRDVTGQRFVHVRASEESIRRATDVASPGWVITPRWSAGKPTTLNPLQKAIALVRLADQSFNYNYLGADGFRTLDRVVRQADCFSLEYSDIDDVIGRLTMMSER
jgi:HprK-related kinase A